MTSRPSHSLRPDRAALGMRWLVLVVIMFGTIISSVGGMNSHGIAAITAVLHSTPMTLDVEPDEEHGHVHGHVHEAADGGLSMGSSSAAGDHPHHGVDHSHDKAHALPTTWSMATPQLPGWFGHVRLWIETVQASRLERPPMG